MNSAKAVFHTCLVLFLLVLGLPVLQAESSFARGEELFLQNRPQEALRYLEAAVSEDPAHVQASLFLGITYLQLNRLDDAIAAYRRILPRGGIETARIAFNLGNVYFLQGDNLLARQYFTHAIEANPMFASAYLNRANSFVRTGDLADAIRDYRLYLSLSPNSPQREQILRLISFIQEEFAAEEERRIIAEEMARRAEEMARLEEERQIEAARVEAERLEILAREEAERLETLARIEAERLETLAREEAERRRRLLAEVSQSIQAAIEGTTGLSAGAEGLQDFDIEFELE